MRSEATSPQAYIESLPDDRKQMVSALRDAITNNLPAGFEETMGYGMIGFVIPHSVYPKGYHCDPKLPVPFINIASQKNYVVMYHMGLYSEQKLLEWFQSEWAKFTSKKLDMGKGCVRFKKLEDIPVGIIGELATKITAAQLIEFIEKVRPQK